MKLLNWSPKQGARFIGLLFVALLVAAQLAPDGSTADQVLKRFDGIFYDVRLKAALSERSSYDDPKIVIIDIDEASLREQGRWPWSRRKVSDLINKLFDNGAIVVGFDVLFSEPQRNPVAEIVNALPEEDSLHQMLLPHYQLMDADAVMSETLANGDVVLGVLFESDENALTGNPPNTTIELIEEGINIRRVKATPYAGYIGNLEMLQENAFGEGFINSSPDIDGYIRRSGLMIQYQGQLYPSLALETARVFSLADDIKVEVEQHSGYYNILSVKLNDQEIPTDENGRVLVPYRGEAFSFPYISATDVLEGRVNPDDLMESIVLVGTSAVGLADLRATPMGIQYPGVEVHANVLEGILHPELFSYRPDVADYYVSAYLIVFGILMAILLPNLGPKRMAVWGSSLLFVTVASNYQLWTSLQTALPLTTPILLAISITGLNIAVGFFAENSQKKAITGMFGQYVPPAHVDKMLKDPSFISLEGERKEMSVLFSDIRSFTTISESLSANELKQMLNRYFSPITKSIFDHNGTIDKYVGDMVMAFWGAPLDDEYHAKNSITTAFDMLRLTTKLRNEFVAEGWPAVRIGIGINTGQMNVGDMGSEFRKAYTVLGDAVNLGSRLEGLTKFYGVEILVSEHTKRHAEAFFEFRSIDRVKVKGKNEAVAIFEPICEKGQLDKTDASELAQFELAYQTYLAQDWSSAKSAFDELIKLNPQRKLYSIYVERVAELSQLPKQQDWDGSYTHTSK